MKYTLKNESIAYYNDTESFDFPKYTSQLINWANQNAQGTRPKVVGQLSELLPEFLLVSEDKTIGTWEQWYTKKQPDALNKAAEKIYAQVLNLKEAIKISER